MVKPARTAVACLCLGAGVAAHADCDFDAQFEITNPFDPSCGGRILTYTEDDGGDDRIPLGYPVPFPVASLTPVDGFRDYASLHARHQLLATDSDAIAAEVVGQTVAGRDIWAYVFGDEDHLTVDGLAEPAMLVSGGIHAREWAAPEVSTAILEELAAIASDGGVGSFLADNVTVIIVPVLNVDGFVQTQAYPDTTTADVDQPRDGRMRRKNLRHPERASPVDEDITTVDDNFYGVDVNRNAVEGFGQNGGSSASTTSLLYRGESPQSEPELEALEAASRLGPRNRLRFFEDLHSFGRIYLPPLTGNVRRDELTIDLIARMRGVTSFVYGVGAAEAGGSIGTTADDFAYGLQIPSWTLELEPRFGGGDYGGTGASHSGFVLPEAQIARVRDEMALIHELAFYVQAGPPRVQAVEIREAASGDVVYAAAWQPGVTRTLDVSVNRALLAGTQYRLWLAFDRPMRWRDENGDISEFPGQNVAPFPALTLEAPSLDAELAITGDASAWLEQPGGAPDGFLRYRDDALGVDFTLPAALAGAGATPLVLSIASTDLAAVFIDANPATPVDWRNGHWAGYEDALGEAGDRGGSDCAIQPFSAASADAAPPAGGAICAIALAPPPEPPPPAPPPPPPSSGGGGAAGLGALSAALYALWRRRCRRGATSDE